MQYTGTVKKYIADKGYGFIKSSAQSEDIFFHFSALVADSWNGQDPRGESEKGKDDGDKVEFDLEQDQRGRTRAANVKLAGAASEEEMAA